MVKHTQKFVGCCWWIECVWPFCGVGAERGNFNAKYLNCMGAERTEFIFFMSHVTTDLPVSRQCSEAVVQRCYGKKMLLKISQNSQENTCGSLFFNKVLSWGLQLYKKVTLAQVFSCKFCEISKNNFFKRTPLVAASECCHLFQHFRLVSICSLQNDALRNPQLKILPI